MKYFFKLTAAYIRRFSGIILLGVIFGIVIFFIVNRVIPAFTISEKKVGLTGRYRSTELPGFILRMIGEGLTEYSEDGSVKPSLASEWRQEDNGKKWIFTLDTNKVWQDGDKLDSSDLNYNFSDVEIKKESQDKISFTLKNPYSPFPYIVERPVFKKGLLGTGEWKVKKIVLKGEYVSQLILVNGKKERQVFNFYPTTETLKTAFKLGQVDQILEITDPVPFQNWKNVEIKENYNFNQVVTLFFDTQDPHLGDKSLRQALTYSINKDVLGKRAISPISPSSWAFNAQVKDYNYDSAKAKEILSDLPGEVKNDLDINIVAVPSLLSVAEKISKDWSAIGVKSNVHVSSIVPTDFQAYLTILDIPRDPDQYSYWHSTQENTNVSNYDNKRVDKLLEEGRTQLDQEERKKTYLDFQRFLLEDLPAVFLYYPQYYEIDRK